MNKDINDILEKWPGERAEQSARKIVGLDGTELVQLRIDMGILQMFVDGRPDGEKPFGQPSLLEHLQRVTRTQPEPAVEADMWNELDREIMQYYHRRRALLILGARSHAEGNPADAAGYYVRAVRDADHNLQIMDFIKTHCGDEEYVESHEQYRPFVLMHRTLAEAQSELIRDDPDEAIERLKAGIRTIEDAYRQGEQADLADQDPSLAQLRALERQVRAEHNVVQTLQEQLDVAVTDEEYERAAQLRDRLRQKRKRKSL